MNEKKLNLEQLEWIAFLIIMVILFFSTQTNFGTENYSRLYRLDLFFVVLLLSLSVMVNNGVLKIRIKELFSYAVICIPNIVLVGISFVCYLFYKRVSFSVFLSVSLKQILVCFMAVTVYYSFGKRCIRGVITAAIINYSIYIFMCVIQFGPLSLFQAGTDTNASRFLEVHELTFVFGLIIIYLIMENYFVRVEKKWIYLLVIFCLLGFKRILLVAMAVALILFLGLKKMKKPKMLFMLSSFIIVASLFWIYICSSWTIFTGISSYLGIDTKGRNWIYQGFYPYYQFSSSYVGAGMGYVQELIYTIPTMFINGHYIGLHNEYLRLYIELGFYPYVFYFALLLPLTIAMIYKKKGMDAAVKYFSLWAVTLVCMLTDNLYPNYMLTLYVLILSSINEHDDVKLIEE